jgi:hypothetical protein
MACKGVVKGNVIILEEGERLPEGARVLISLEHRQPLELPHEEIEERRQVVARMEEFGRRLSGRHINLGDLILEGREELDSRA